MHLNRIKKPAGAFGKIGALTRIDRKHDYIHLRFFRLDSAENLVKFLRSTGLLTVRKLILPVPQVQISGMKYGQAGIGSHEERQSNIG